jgi:hypothetical protein
MIGAEMKRKDNNNTDNYASVLTALFTAVYQYYL